MHRLADAIDGLNARVGRTAAWLVLAMGWFKRSS